MVIAHAPRCTVSKRPVNRSFNRGCGAWPQPCPPSIPRARQGKRSSNALFEQPCGQAAVAHRLSLPQLAAALVKRSAQVRLQARSRQWAMLTTWIAVSAGGNQASNEAAVESTGHGTDLRALAGEPARLIEFAPANDLGIVA